MPGVLDMSDFEVHHRPATIELRIGYDFDDGDGNPLATIEQVGRDNLQKTLRPSRTDATQTALELRDPGGEPVLSLVHQRALKSSLDVCTPAGDDIGSFRLENLVGKSRFTVTAGPTGATVGTLAARTWKRKNFALATADGSEVARVDMTKGSSGDFSHDNRWAVHIEQPLDDPMRALAVAAVIAVDMILWERR
jgi:hypothetical protein